MQCVILFFINTMHTGRYIFYISLIVQTSMYIPCKINSGNKFKSGY